jgi:PD-(D/E)XK nuclease superfamily
VAEQLVLSTTAFGEALTSLRRYYYRNVLHLVPRPHNIKAVLRRGIWVHACLEHYRKHGDFLPALDALCKYAEEMNLDPQEIEDRRTETERIMMGWINFYWGQEKWETLATEERLSTEIGGVTLTCTLDWRGRIPSYGHMIGEYKTAREIPSPSWRSVDPQTALQTIIASRQPDMEQVDGIIFDYLLTREPSVPQVKKDGTFYANAFERTTTTVAFEKGAQRVRDILAGMATPPQTAEDYIEDARSKMVNDSRFYQRYVVLKPKAVLVQTLKSVAYVAGKISLAQRIDHWPCECNSFIRQKMCGYGRLCTVEETTGRPAEGLREAEYMTDDGVREGDAMQKYLSMEGDED